jgi:LysM repeat protein
MKRLLSATILFSLSLMMMYGNPTDKMTVEQYINKYKDLAIKEMKRTGIPASITMAQAILESGTGNSTLARKSNNHFGIKCHKDWKGKKVYHDDDKRHECFRKYKTVYDSYKDHSKFLTGKGRYASLFKLKSTDYKNWAHGLKKAGYATDPHYAHRLIKIIEDYKLYQLDRKGGGKNRYSDEAEDKAVSATSGVDDFVIDPYTDHEVKYNNKVKYVDVEEGDTFESIAEEYDLRLWEIYHYNDMPEDADINNFKHLYIEAKRRKADKSEPYHVVKKGETLQRISHKYGIKLKSILKYNNIDEDDKLLPGTKLNLRRKKK